VQFSCILLPDYLRQRIVPTFERKIRQGLEWKDIETLSPRRRDFFWIRHCIRSA